MALRAGAQGPTEGAALPTAPGGPHKRTSTGTQPSQPESRRAQQIESVPPLIADLLVFPAVTNSTPPVTEALSTSQTSVAKTSNP